MSIGRIIILVLCLVELPAFGQQPQIVALTFQNWKEQQVLEAQNQMLRTSTRINQIKLGKPQGPDSKDSTNSGLPSGRIKKSVEGDQLAAAEKDIKRAQESLEAANTLVFEDYINIYLPSLQDQPEAINKLADKLSKEELAQIFKSQTKRSSKPGDARRNAGSSLEGLASAARLKAL